MPTRYAVSCYRHYHWVIPSGQSASNAWKEIVGTGMWGRELWWATIRHEIVIAFLGAHKNYRVQLPQFEGLLEGNCHLWERRASRIQQRQQGIQVVKAFAHQNEKHDKLSNEPAEKQTKEDTLEDDRTGIGHSREREIKVTGSEERKIMLRRKGQGTREKPENCKRK